MKTTENNAKTPYAKAGFFARVALFCVCGLLVSLCAAGSAVAAPPTTFCSLGSFGSKGTAAGECNDPSGVAVDQSSGNVYVADRNNNRIDVFDVAGHFRRAFGWGVLNGAAELQVCTSTCESGRYGPGTGQFNPVAVAVDQSSHDVYVTDSENHRVEKFTANGEFVLMLGKEVNETADANLLSSAAERNLCTAVSGDTCGAGAPGSDPGAVTDSLALALDASNNLWVAEAEHERLEQFSPAGELIGETPLPGAGGISSLAIDTDPSSPSFGDFYTLTSEFPAKDEAQKVRLSPSGGEYTLTFGGQTTRILHWTTPIEEREVQLQASELLSALEELSTIGPHNVSVSCEDPTPPKPACDVNFVGALGGTDVEQMTASAGVTVETQFQGKAATPAVLSKRKPDGEQIETLDASGHPQALGLDPASGDLFVSDQAEPDHPGSATLLEFDPSGAQIEAFGTGKVVGAPNFNALAFDDAAQSLYVTSDQADKESAAQIFTLPAPGPVLLEGTSKATQVKKTTATLCSKLNSEGAGTTFHYQYVTAKQYEEDGNSFGAGTLETPVSAPLGADFETREACQPVVSLTPAGSYRFRILATNVHGSATGETATFQPLPPAMIDSTSVTDVTAGSATLEAEVNPLGDATSYRFEYITEAGYLHNQAAGEPLFAGASRIPGEGAGDVAIGAGEEDVAVSQHPQGLSSNTVYRYRLVAINALDPTGYAGTALTFTTQTAGSFSLPDARQWELVSPLEKQGALLDSFSRGNATFQAAAAGDAVTYFAANPFEAESQGNSEGAQAVSRRGSSGWSSRDISPPHTEATDLHVPLRNRYPFFSSDLARSVLESNTRFEASLSPAASEQTPYLRSDFPSDTAGFCTEACYRPLVTGCPEAGESCPPSVEELADVAPGTRFGATGKCIASSQCTPSFEGATTDLTHIVLRSSVALTPLSKGGGLYEWSQGKPPGEQLQLISILSGGEPTDGRFNAISEDGSRVVWFNSSTNHLYLRDTLKGELDGETVQLDALRGGSGSGEVKPSFEFAAADDSIVYFSDEQRLTPGSGASRNGADLYRCQIVEVAGHLQCELTDITPEVSGEPAGLKGTVLGGAPDGSSAYFVADGVLTGEERNGHGEEARSGACESESSLAGVTCNLYSYNDGTVRLVAVLAAADYPSWGASGLASSAERSVLGLSARVSPNGRWLAFMSSRSLTGYDNRDASTGNPVEELYLYDGDSGKLRCVSCDPTGARPLASVLGRSFKGSDEESFLGGQGWGHADPFVAALVPGWTTTNHQARYLSNSGRLFFDDFDALVPQDFNGTWDVYEYEPAGVGGCNESSSTFGAVSAGCVGLISSGTSPDASAFVDASESGNDVFFYTEAKLASGDLDTARDMYDAHVCSTEVPCLPPPPPPVPACNGDSCQSPVAAPEDPTPGSLTFRGPGNLLAPVAAPVAKPRSLTRAQKLVRALRACRSKPKHEQAVCKRRARRTYGRQARVKKSNRGAR